MFVSICTPRLTRNSKEISLRTFELLHSSIQPMLHHVAHVHVALPNLCIWHGQNRLHILQCKSVAFHTLKCLCTTNECLYIFRINLKDGSTILDDTVKVGDLFVTSGSVGMSFDGEVGLGFTAFL